MQENEEVALGCRIVEKSNDWAFQEYDLLADEWITLFNFEVDGVEELRNMATKPSIVVLSDVLEKELE